MRRYLAAASVATALLVTSAANGQDYPNKVIRIVAGSVGGGNDFVARVVAQGITSPMGQPVIVDNRGPGVIPIEYAAKMPPDGHTLLVNGSTLWTIFLLQKTSYDPLRDFAPITLATIVPNLLVVHPSLPVKSVKDLIALAKARPGELNYASTTTGGSGHLAGELLKSMAGVNIVRIPYKGNAPQISAVISGEVEIAIADIGLLEAHAKSGRVRAIAITSAQPSALYPGMPTVAATVPGYELIGTTGIYAPAKTPQPIINRLNQEMVRVLRTPDIKEKFLSTGTEVIASSPEDLAALIKSDMARMAKVIKDAGIKGD